MSFLDDIKNKIKNVDTDKLKEQIGNATGAAKNAVQQNLESFKNGQAGEKFNNLKGEYQKMPKNKKIIFGVCAIVALFIVIGGIKSISGSDNPITKLAGKWNCKDVIEFDFNIKDKTGSVTFMDEKPDIGPLNITTQNANEIDVAIIVNNERPDYAAFNIKFTNDDQFTMRQKGMPPVTCIRLK